MNTCLILEKNHKSNLVNKIEIYKNEIEICFNKQIIPKKPKHFIFISISRFYVNCSIYKSKGNKKDFYEIRRFSFLFPIFVWKTLITNYLTISNKLILNSHYIDLSMGDYKRRNYHPSFIMGSVLKWILFFKKFKRICLRSIFKLHTFNSSKSDILQKLNNYIVSIIYLPINPPIDLFVNKSFFCYTKKNIYSFYRENCKKIVNFKKFINHDSSKIIRKNIFLYVDNGLYFLHPDNNDIIPISQKDRYEYALNYSKKIIFFLKRLEKISGNTFQISLHPRAQKARSYFPDEKVIDTRASDIFPNYFFCITGYSTTFYEINDANIPCILLRDKILEKHSFNARDMGNYFEENKLPFCWTDSDFEMVEKIYNYMNKLS